MKKRRFTINITRRGSQKSVTLFEGPFCFYGATKVDTSAMSVDNYAAELGRMLRGDGATVEYRIRE